MVAVYIRELAIIFMARRKTEIIMGKNVNDKVSHGETNNGKYSHVEQNKQKCPIIV